MLLKQHDISPHDVPAARYIAARHADAHFCVAGQILTSMQCPASWNTGCPACTTCLGAWCNDTLNASVCCSPRPLAPIYASVSAAKGRKYAHTLEYVQASPGGAWVGVHSALANRMALALIQQVLLPELGAIIKIEQEVG